MFLAKCPQPIVAPERVVTAAQQIENNLANAPRRQADFLRFAAHVTTHSARQSAGGHFREEHQTSDGEALRDDERMLQCMHGNFKVTGNARSCIASRYISRTVPSRTKGYNEVKSR